MIYIDRPVHNANVSMIVGFDTGNIGFVPFILLVSSARLIISSGVLTLPSFSHAFEFDKMEPAELATKKGDIAAMRTSCSNSSSSTIYSQKIQWPLEEQQDPSSPPQSPTSPVVKKPSSCTASLSSVEP